MMEETETLAEHMQQAGDSGVGDALSMQDLEGKPFQIITYTPGESEGKYGKRRWNLAQIIVEEDGEEAYEAEAFLSGTRVNRVLDWLLYEQHLPIKARVIRRSDLQGNPWDLVPADAELPMDEALPHAEEAPEPPKDSKLVQAAKKAGARTAGHKDVVTVRHKGGVKASMPWDEFCGLWQGEGYGLDELADVCGASGAKAVTHWFAADKDRTITVLKVEATKRRKPLQEEPMPFE